MKCSECGNEIFELNEASERWLWCPICGHEEKLKDGENCDHEFVNSDGGFKGICKKCGKLKDGEKP
jgi:DNA-directed RNA polymerase subunit M/transcription elongation factor TFIIS